MTFNAKPLAKDGGTDRLQFGLQILPLDTGRPVTPSVYTLYLPASAASVTSIVFSATAPAESDGAVWVKIIEGSGHGVELPVSLNGISGIYPIYVVSVSMYSDGAWWGLENAALYDIKKQQWVTL